MSTLRPSLHVAAVGQREHGTMALVVAMAVRFGYAGPLESAAGWESPRRSVRLFNGRHQVSTDDGRRAMADAVVVVVDGDEGPRAGTREQVRAARQVGVEHVVVFLNRASALDAAVLVLAADEAMTWWTSQYAGSGMSQPSESARPTV